MVDAHSTSSRPASIIAANVTKGDTRMINSTRNADYDYELQGDTLIIKLRTDIWCMDIVPSRIREIFYDMPLGEVEGIRYIHIEEVEYV